MGEQHPETRVRPHQHRRVSGRRECLYETVIRHAIVSQHGLRDDERLELRSCEGCGKPFLLQTIWQASPEEGELACPLCGTLTASWDGTRAYVAYWQRELDG